MNIEKELLLIAERNKKDIILSCLGILFFSVIILFFCYFVFISGVLSFIKVIYLLSSILICSFFEYLLFLGIFVNKDIYPHKSGIHIKLKKRYFNIIKYRDIELIIMNEAGSGGAYVDIFFTSNGKKYIYRPFQRRIKNYKEFIEELRNHGVEVKVLEPSYWIQKRQYFGWIANMMRGREFVW